VPTDLDARERRGLRLGVAGAVLAFLALTTVQAVAIRPYLPPDELYHVGYAASLLEGRLPTLTTPLPADTVPLMPQDERPRRVYVANHPPLFHALAAVPIGIGERLGAPMAGFLAARLLSVALAAAGVVLVAWLALLLVPGRPRIAVGAAWLAALLPGLPHVSAFVYTDGLGFLAATAALAAATATVRRGPTPARLAGLTAAAAAAALTRAPGLVLVGFAGAATAAGFLLHGRRRGAGRLLAAAVAGAAVAGLAAASALWFYLRNRSLYGSLTGAAYNQALFRLVPQDHAPALLTSPRYALRLYDGLWVWTRFALPRPPTLAALVTVPRAIGLLAPAGLAGAAARPLRGPAPAAPSAPARPARGPAAVVAWALAGAWTVAVFAMVAFYDGSGGHTHPRYLFPGLAVLAVVAALGLDGLPGARLGLWTAAVTLTQLALTAVAWAGFVTAWRSRRPTDPADLLGAVAGMLDAAGARPPWLLLGLAGAALLAALALLALALGSFRADRAPAPPAPAPPPAEAASARAAGEASPSPATPPAPAGTGAEAGDGPRVSSRSGS
jgi:hypothetical protein